MGSQATWIEQQPFLIDVEEMHWRAVRELKRARSTGESPGNDTLIQMLSQVHLLELTLTFRNLYKSRAAAKKQSSKVADKLLAHAMEKQSHAESVSARIARLGGERIWNANGLPPTSHMSRLEGVPLADMVRESLLAETFIIDLCRNSIEFLGNSDPTTTALLEKILESEERQIFELTALVDEVSGTKLDGGDQHNEPHMGDSEGAWNKLFAASAPNSWFSDLILKDPIEE
ncbi:MAG TPA: ferritin-like domain-containing protein [Pyrinomonadaceae bacterium]|nr:ferritin-like domain-containing protein [Pyrinomonadaceae bacterium]